MISQKMIGYFRLWLIILGLTLSNSSRRNLTASSTAKAIDSAIDRAIDTVTAPQTEYLISAKNRKEAEKTDSTSVRK